MYVEPEVKVLAALAVAAGASPVPTTTEEDIPALTPPCTIV